MNICNICRYGINVSAITHLPCGHGFHRWCIHEQLECGRYHCAVESCEEPFFFVQLNRRRLGQGRVYIVPDIHLGNESRRDIKALADTYNYNFKFATVLFRTNVEERVYRKVSNMMDRIIYFDNHEGILNHEDQKLIYGIHKLGVTRLILRVYFVVCTIAIYFILDVDLISAIKMGLSLESTMRYRQSNSRFVQAVVYLVYVILESFVRICRDEHLL